VREERREERNMQEDRQAGMDEEMNGCMSEGSTRQDRQDRVRRQADKKVAEHRGWSGQIVRARARC
jgi:hypothetical protein